MVSHQIPGFALLRPIGQGGYGEVWLARSVTGLLRAVKIVDRHAFKGDEPFEREYRGICSFEPVSLAHPGYVAILHVGRGEDFFYYVMELADDAEADRSVEPENYRPKTLKSVLALRPRFSSEECVAAALCLARTLEHLHTAGLAHRDLKPSNILYVDGALKLADFGLVVNLDATRSLVGTEGYVPLAGSAVHADLFALGIILYEMSTGRSRFDFPELPGNLRELPEADQILELNQVVLRACAGEAGSYRSAREMIADLEAIAAGVSLRRRNARRDGYSRVVRRAFAGCVVVGALTGVFYLREKPLATPVSRAASGEPAAKPAHAPGKAPFAPLVFDLSRDFESANQPGSPWQVGHMVSLPSEFIPFQTRTFSPDDLQLPIISWTRNGREPSQVSQNPNTQPSVTNNGEGIFAPGEVWLSAGMAGATDNYSVVRLTIPAHVQGTFFLSAAFTGRMLKSGSAEVGILIRGKPVFTQELSRGKPEAVCVSDARLAPGDTLDFAVGRGADGSNFGDSVGLNLTVSLRR